MVQNSHRAHSGQATCVAAFLHKDPVFLSCGEDNTVLLEDICCPTPASQMGHSASGYLLASLALHPQQTKVFVFGDENGTVPPRTPRVQAVPSARGCSPRVSLGQCSLHTVLPSWPLSVTNYSLATLRRFRSQAHRNFVSNATWSSLNHSLLTTAGWDREVLHHFMPTEPLPESGTKSVA
ncbi:hypothetical protein Celaphus_00011942, partial [Cervus elaphus hippelaphus]